MASTIGSDIFAASALLVISLLVLLLLRHFLPLRSAPAYLLVPIFLSLVLPASVILLVPIDLASSARTEDEDAKGIWLPERAILVSWRISYWLTFVLTWLILPLLGQYMDAGYREPKARMMYSLRSNGRYQLIVLGCATAGLVYISISEGFKFTAIKALIMALAYVWGLILAIYLMGHGLVALPRRMFRNADISGRLRRIEGRAPVVHEKLENTILNLEELEAQISLLKQRKTGTAHTFQQWIDDLADMTSLPESRATSNPAMQEASTIPAVVTERYLAELTRRLARAKHQKARYVEEWDSIVQTASDLRTILDSRALMELNFGRPSPQFSFLEKHLHLTPYMRYRLHIHVIPVLRIILGSMFALASIAIIWSEIIKFPAPQLSAVSLTVVHHPNNKEYQVGFGGQLVAAAWVCYMCTCALSSVNDVPVWGQRALVRRNTYSESACWYAGQIAKLTVPLSYNFLTFLPRDIHQNTTFYNFLGRLINLTPLGTGFDYFFPVLILIPVCATLFNLYGKIKNIFGFGILEDEDDKEDNPSGYGTGGWREGHDLIARDLHGPGASSLGLSDAPRPSLANMRSARQPPNVWVPPGERPNNQSQTSTSQQARVVRANARSQQRPTLDPEPDEENFFTLFGRRVKNTIDTLDTPKWIQPSSSSANPKTAGFRRPKWMMGGDVAQDDNDDSGAPRSQSNSNVGRIFGGRASDGQIRI